MEKEFADAGYDAQTCPGLNFSVVMEAFAKAYINAVERSQVLHHIVEIRYLKGIVTSLERLEAPVQAISVNTSTLPGIKKQLEELTDAVLIGQADLKDLVQALTQLYDRREQVAISFLISVLQRIPKPLKVAEPVNAIESTKLQHEIQLLREEISRREEQGLSATELEELEEFYRRQTIESHRLLTFQGMLQHNQPVSVPMTDVFVPLSLASAKPTVITPEEEQLRRQLEAAEKFPKQSSLSADQREELTQRLEKIEQERWNEAGKKSKVSEALLEHKTQAFALLGDPGSGKTTLLRYLTLTFAESKAAERLSINEQRLPIFLPLAAYDAALANSKDVALSDFLADYYKTNRELPGLAPLFEKFLREGRAIVLFDGLDEVLEVSTRQLIAQRVQAFINRYLPLGNRIIMTSRVVGYQDVRLSSETIAHFRVLSLDEKGISRFIHAWSLAFTVKVRDEALDSISSETIREAGSIEQRLHKAIKLASVKKLASNPLLLTILAIVSCQAGLVLPRRRVELYDRYSRVLLEIWNRVRSQAGRPVGKSLEFLGTAKILSHLALWLQQNRPSGMARSGDVQQQLCDYYLSRKGYFLSGNGDKAPSSEVMDAVEKETLQFLQDVREHSGLLIERGKDTYGFMHLTFQEYFAAWALAKMPTTERWQFLCSRLHDSRWREVILLTSGHIGVIDANEREATTFVEQILSADSRHNEFLRQDELLAAACLADEI
ncbi:MAG: NACHT domain-containing protein, partial [Cyanobacteria bacterium P01_D01_bin.56]